MDEESCVDGAPFPSLSLPFYICTLAPPRGHVQSQAGGGGVHSAQGPMTVTFPLP